MNYSTWEAAWGSTPRGLAAARGSGRLGDPVVVGGGDHYLELDAGGVVAAGVDRGGEHLVPEGVQPGLAAGVGHGDDGERGEVRRVAAGGDLGSVQFVADGDVAGVAAGLGLDPGVEFAGRGERLGCRRW